MKMIYSVLVFIFFMEASYGDSHKNADQVEVVDFAPNLREKSVIRNCLNRIPIQSYQGQMSCRQMRGVMATLRHNRRRPRNIQEMSALYSDKMVKMKNSRNSNADGSFINMVASCAGFAPSLHKKWNDFFVSRTKRSRFRRLTRLPESQTTSENNLTAVFTTVDQYRKSYGRLDRAAVDLLLRLAPPRQINEQYNEYSVVVIRIVNESTVVLHRSKQSFCPTLQGRFMVLSLDINKTTEWFFNQREPLSLLVTFQPLQRFSPETPNSEPDYSNIVREAVGLMFSFRDNRGERHHQPRLQNINNIFYGNLRRRIRRATSTAITSRHANRLRRIGSRSCRRVSYVVDFQAYWRRNIQYPLQYDIGECAGVCDLPFPSHMLPSNHAIVLKMKEALRQTSSRTSRVNCVPKTYRDLQFWSRGANGTLTDDFWEDMVVDKCTCA